MDTDFEPGPGTLNTLRSQFARRVQAPLRAIARGAAVARDDVEAHPSLATLAGQLLELRGQLDEAETAVDRVARGYLLLTLRLWHGDARDPSSTPPAELAQSMLATLREGGA